MTPDFPDNLDGKESACNAGDPTSIPGLGRSQPTSVFLPAEFHWQRDPMDYIPWGHKESDTTECLTLSLSQT